LNQRAVGNPEVLGPASLTVPPSLLVPPVDAEPAVTTPLSKVATPLENATDTPAKTQEPASAPHTDNPGTTAGPAEPQPTLPAPRVVASVTAGPVATPTLNAHDGKSCELDGLVLTMAAGESVAGSAAVEVVLTVRNTTDTNRDQVAVEVQVPDGCHVGTPEPAFLSGQAAWDLGTLAAAEVRPLRVRVQPPPGKAVLVQACLRRTARASITLPALTAQVELRAREHGNWQIGQAQRLEIDLINAGPVLLKGLRIQPQLPTWLQLAASDLPEREIAELPPGGKHALSWLATPVQAGEGQATFRVQSADGLDQQLSCPVCCRAQSLRLRVRGPEESQLPDVCQFTAELSNESDQPLRQVALLVAFGRELRLVDAERGATIDRDSHVLGWIVEELPAGQTQVLRWWAVGQEGGQVRQQIVAESSTGARQTAEVATRLLAPPGLLLELADPKETVDVGDEIIYRVRLANQREQTQGPLILEGNFGSGLEPLSTEALADRQWTERRVLMSVGRLEPGQVRWFQVRVRAAEPGQQSIQFTVRNEAGQAQAELTKATLVRDTGRTMLR